MVARRSGWETRWMSIKGGHVVLPCSVHVVLLTGLLDFPVFILLTSSDPIAPPATH